MDASSPKRNEDRDDSFRVPPRQKRKHDKKPDKIISQLFQDPHPSPLSPNLMSSPGLPKGKSPVVGKMTDAVLDRLSILLMSGCSIQLACNEVGLARTTFYRWTERIHRMQADLSWASVSESYRMFARAVTSYNIKKESEGSDLRSPVASPVASPVKLSASVDGTCLGLPSLASDPSTQATTLPGITPTNFANIPNRLRRHFLHMMHTAIKKQFAPDKSWPSMDDAEKHSLQQLSETVLAFPTNISAPLVFTWDGATVTKHFSTYEFLRPVSLQLMIRYLRDRCYRAKPQRPANGATQSEVSSASLVDAQGSGSSYSESSGSKTDDSEMSSFECHEDLEFEKFSGVDKRAEMEGTNGFHHSDRNSPAFGFIHHHSTPTIEAARSAPPTFELATPAATDHFCGDVFNVSSSGAIQSSTNVEVSSSDIDELSSSLAIQCACDELVAKVQEVPIMNGLLELTSMVSGKVMIVHHGRGNSVQWLLNHTSASSICAMDWCPIVNASTSNLLQQFSGAVAVSLPGHVLLSEEPEFLGAYDTIIDTHVAVFNLDYPPLFPEKQREPFEVVKHIQSIETSLRAGGVAFLLCQGAAIFNAVVFNVLSSSLEVVRVVRCLSPGQRHNSHSHSDSSAEEIVWVITRKKK